MRFHLVDHAISYYQTHMLHFNAEKEDSLYWSPSWTPARNEDRVGVVLQVVHYSIDW